MMAIVEMKRIQKRKMESHVVTVHLSRITDYCQHHVSMCSDHSGHTGTAALESANAGINKPAKTTVTMVTWGVD